MKPISDDQIRRLYGSPKYGLMSVPAFTKKLKREYDVTASRVREVVSTLETAEITTGRRTKRRQMYQTWANERRQYMADLAFLPKYKGVNRGFHILLTMIDMNTRQAYAFPFKKKSDVPLAMDKVFKDLKVKVFETDMGSEFVNKEMKRLYTKYGIEHVKMVSGENHRSTGMIERFNRTLKSKINRLFIQTGKNIWIDYLDDILESYNDTPHTGNLGGKAPDEVTKPDMIRQRLLRRNRAHRILWEDDIDPGDTVRLRQQKGTFGKESTPWTPQTYLVSEVQGLGYRVTGPDGLLRRKYMPYELKLVKNNVPVKSLRSKTQAAKTRQEATTTRKVNRATKNLELKGTGQRQGTRKRTPVTRMDL